MSRTFYLFIISIFMWGLRYRWRFLCFIVCSNFYVRTVSFSLFQWELQSINFNRKHITLAMRWNQIECFRRERKYLHFYWKDFIWKLPCDEKWTTRITWMRHGGFMTLKFTCIVSISEWNSIRFFFNSTALICYSHCSWQVRFDIVSRMIYMEKKLL